MLFHPDTQRVGDVARLGDGRVELARDTLGFVPPGESVSAPLADRHLSRQPLVVVPDSKGGVEIGPAPGGMEVRVDGELLRGSRLASSSALENGVVIELAKRVVLLLHRAGKRQLDRPPALGLVGASDVLDEVRRNVLRVADMDVPVLIRGETGTGKELIAAAVHGASKRAGAQLVSVNMAAIPASTAASELFGHRKGAFTGAVDAHVGYFEKASGGTLFLDEIGATPADVQPMLLRALESQEVQPLGGTSPRRVNTRLIAATDADLEHAISNESFRAALLHRLEGYQLFVPALRARRDDIGRLLMHFLRIELAATGEQQRIEPSDTDAAPWLPTKLVARLVRFDWPGNVRQLRNVVRQLAISGRGAPFVRIDSALSRLLEPEATAPPATTKPPEGRAECSEDDMIRALRASGWQSNKAATALGISRTTMYERIKKSTRIRQAKDIDADEIRACQTRCNGELTAMAAELEVSKRALALRIKELAIA